MENEAVSNTGPILHLSELNLLQILKIFKIIIPPEVKEELKKYRAKVPSNIKVRNLDSHYKNISQIIMDEFSLDLGESEAIALTLQEKRTFFLTNDLDARITANYYNIETHGTIGIILRSFRQGLLNKNKTIDKIKELHTNSSLFITKNLIDEVIESIERFKR